MKIIVALLMVLAVTACGKRGPPVAPGPADKITYPKGYPAY